MLKVIQYTVNNTTQPDYQLCYLLNWNSDETHYHFKKSKLIPITVFLEKKKGFYVKSILFFWVALVQWKGGCLSFIEMNI